MKKNFFPIFILFTVLSSCQDNELALKPQILSVSSDSGFIGETITLTGKGFNNLGNAKITMGNEIVKIQSVTETEIKFNIPKVLASQTVSIDLKINGISCHNKPNFHILTWKKLLDFPFAPRFAASSFIIGDKLYVGFGANQENDRFKDFWEIDLSSGAIKKLSDFPGSARFACSSFSIGAKGYIVLGRSSTEGLLNELWEYNPKEDLWTRKADFPGYQRDEAVVFVLKGKAYVGNGLANGSTGLNDFYEYESSNDRWTQVASFPGNGIYGQAAFVRKNKAYLVGGVRNNSDIVTDVWEFSKDKWIQKAPFPGRPVVDGSGFNAPNISCFGFGVSEGNEATTSNYLYNPKRDNWTMIQDFDGPSRFNPISGSNSRYWYYGLGYNFSQDFNDLWVINFKNQHSAEDDGEDDDD